MFRSSAPSDSAAQPVDDGGPEEAVEGNGDVILGSFDVSGALADDVPRAEEPTVLHLNSLRGMADAFRPEDAPRDDRDEFSKAVGARFWIREARIEWSKTWDGRAHVFSREYRVERILLDVFASDGRIVRAEILEKTKNIEKYNAAHPGKEYGYLPMIRGNIIPPEVMEAVMDHQIYSLIGGAPIRVVA